MKNEEIIKDMIVSAHKRGTCDGNGNSIKTSDGRFITKPRPLSSAAKTYVLRDGKMVLKNG